MNEHDAAQDIIVNGYVRRIAELERKLAYEEGSNRGKTTLILDLNKQLAERNALIIEAISIIENMDVLMDKAGMKTDLKPWLAKVRGGLKLSGNSGTLGQIGAGE